MTIHRLDDFDEAVPDVGVVVEVDEGPGEGNSAPTSITFRGLNTRTGTDQTVQIFGAWERHAASRALRWIADRLDGQPDPVAAVREFLEHRTRRLNWHMTQNEIADEAGSLSELSEQNSVNTDVLYRSFEDWCTEDIGRTAISRVDFDDIVQNWLHYDLVGSNPGVWQGMTQD